MTEQKNIEFNLSSQETRELTDFRLIDKSTGLFIIPLVNLSKNDSIIKLNFLKISCIFPDNWKLDPPQKSTIFLEKPNENDPILLVWRINLLESLNSNNWPSIRYLGTNFKD